MNQTIARSLPDLVSESLTIFTVSHTQWIHHSIDLLPLFRNPTLFIRNTYNQRNKYLPTIFTNTVINKSTDVYSVEHRPQSDEVVFAKLPK